MKVSRVVECHRNGKVCYAAATSGVDWDTIVDYVSYFLFCNEKDYTPNVNCSTFLVVDCSERHP